MRGRKRKNSGVGPGVIVKGISKVPMTKDTDWRLKAACDKLDATEGYIVGLALVDWLKKEGI